MVDARDTTMVTAAAADTVIESRRSKVVIAQLLQSEAAQEGLRTKVKGLRSKV